MIHHCPVCGVIAEAVGKVDFAKSCERELNLSPTGKLIEYWRCPHCEFTWAPEMHGWSKAQFLAEVYNDSYGAVDPEYAEIRPAQNAKMLLDTFPDFRERHLDYGGGNGLLSATLRCAGWDSQSHDPLLDGERPDGVFDLITAFEVFEHVPNAGKLFADLNGLLSADGLVAFSTLFAETKDGLLDWWYLAPRNGHISLWSKKSLNVMAKKRGMHFGSASPYLHFLWRRIPEWAAHLF